MKYLLSTRFQKEVQSIVDYILENFGKQYAIDFAEEPSSHFDLYEYQNCNLNETFKMKEILI